MNILVTDVTMVTDVTVVTDVTMVTDVTVVTKIPHRQLIRIQTLTANWSRGSSNSRNRKGVITFCKASKGLSTIGEKRP